MSLRPRVPGGWLPAAVTKVASICVTQKAAIIISSVAHIRRLRVVLSVKSGSAPTQGSSAIASSRQTGRRINFRNCSNPRDEGGRRWPRE